MSVSSAAAAAQKMLLKSERHLFSSSDDAAVMKQILATHAPDGREVDVRALLQIVEDILQRATPTVLVTPSTHTEVIDDKIHHPAVAGMLEALAYTIHKLSWDAKLVLALAAFAIGYGEFWLTAQLHTVNPLAKSVAHLKQLPDILEHSNALKPRFDAINNLIRASLDVTKCIIEFKELPEEYISPDSPNLSVALAHIPTAVYWVIRSIIACTSQIIGLVGLGHEYISSTSEVWELSSLAHKLNNIHGHLTKQLSLFVDVIPHVARCRARRPHFRAARLALAAAGSGSCCAALPADAPLAHAAVQSKGERKKEIERGKKRIERGRLIWGLN